jgi:glyoxylase-like metal-dependent hydrolase (beta-lactamase superfamily II)
MHFGPGMQSIAPNTSVIDLQFLGHKEAIASCLLEAGGELALVDCGPASCLPVLRAQLAERGLAITHLTALLLTHIHFDHAGATGSLVRENPRLRVYVHERGAAHMADPSKLLKSATRLYGDALQPMFGEFVAVPPENLHVLSGGETFQVAGRRMEVAYTPGHASHHVSYFDQSTGIAFTGDTTGLRAPGYDVVAPLTPPPDIDLAAWEQSLTEIARHKPQRIFLTHFGPYADVPEHLDRTRAGLRRWAERARQILALQSDEPAQIAEFMSSAQREFAEVLPEDAVSRYALGSNPTLSWYGLARYWRKGAEAEAAPRAAN